MPRSRPASSPLSHHKLTGQYYVTRGGKRIYLSAAREEALQKYHRFALGLPKPEAAARTPSLSVKELANRFLTAQQANWKNPDTTLRSYRDWIGRFLKDHPGQRAEDFAVEKFAAWKISLRRRGFSRESINHYLTAVRSMYAFAEETEILEKCPKLKKVKYERRAASGSNGRPLYTMKQVENLLTCAGLQMSAMILLALNCGFGPGQVNRIRDVWFFSRGPARLLSGNRDPARCGEQCQSCRRRSPNSAKRLQQAGLPVRR